MNIKKILSHYAWAR